MKKLKKQVILLIKVLQIGATNNLGGIENYLINYYRNIDKELVMMDFVNMYDKICFQDEILGNGSKIYNIVDYKKRPFKYIRELKKILIDGEYDVLHFNMNSAIFLQPLIAAKIAKIPVIIAHSHNSSSDKGFLKELLHRIMKKFIPIFSNTFFACSDYAGNWFFSKKILRSNNFYIINNAIETQKFEFNEEIREKMRKEFNIDNDEIVIGHIGRFNKQKNHEFLIKSFKIALESNLKLKLILVGTGPLKEKIESLVKKMNITDNVIFLGQRNDVCNCYQVFDIFALPSLYEGLPLVGIEAQASGCRCLFSDRITAKLKITDTVKYLSIDSYDEWVREFINEKINLKKRKSVNLSNYDIKTNVRRICEIYSSKLTEGKK